MTHTYYRIWTASLAGYSPHGRKESDTTERLSTGSSTQYSVMTYMGKQSEKSGYAVYNYTLGCTPETKATLKISYTSTSIFEKILNGSGKKRIAFPLGRLDPS